MRKVLACCILILIQAGIVALCFLIPSLGFTLLIYEAGTFVMAGIFWAIYELTQ